ncbi:hypothetical protein [Streptomyces sp. NPDC088707]|uniref:hypothetical protein n=1 Tax=Streptomyces sp. NPDC088707 TaxID=3365871 RepID=UPI003815EE4C
MSEDQPEHREKASFAIDVEHAKRFTALRKAQRLAMAVWVAETVEESNGGISWWEARLEARRRRSELWPTLDQIVEAAVRQRLAEEDLAGPWERLSEAEEEVASLAGRGVGKNYPGFLITRTYELPVSLLRELRTTAVRVSAEPLEELESRGLLYASLEYSLEDYEKRNELVEAVMSAPRIVRQALERYGPWPPDQYPPSSLPALSSGVVSPEQD